MRSYSTKFPPERGDYIGTYEEGELKEAFVVRDISENGKLLMVEVLVLTNGGARPSGDIGFRGAKDTGLRLISRGGLARTQLASKEG